VTDNFAKDKRGPTLLPPRAPSRRQSPGARQNTVIGVGGHGGHRRAISAAGDLATRPNHDLTSALGSICVFIIFI